MAVYVDTMRAQYGRMIMCHMMADTKAELLAMVDTIGVARKWIQHEGSWQEHFDISLAKKSQAVRLGAIEISRKDMVRKMMDRRAPAREEG